MNKKYLFVLALPVFCLLFSCHNSQNNNTAAQEVPIDKTGIAFIKGASELNQADIKAATAAENSSKNPRVIGFAKMILKDHGNTLSKLNDLKSQASVTENYESDASQKKLVDSISKLQGDQFDKAYMKSAMDNGGRTVILYINAIQNKASAINTYASESMTLMQVHLDSARKIYASLKYRV
jgi:putative membrane protein